MYSVRSANILRYLFSRNLIWKIRTNEKKIYITFDDGPIPILTEEILQILDTYNAKGTFFCVGEMVKNHLDVFNKILAQGHAVGNHTFNHLKGWNTKTKDYINNVKLCESYFKTSLFRPPYGRIKVPQIMQIKRDYHIIMWTVLSGDYDESITKEQCLENVKRYTNKGSIVVFHNSIKASEKMLYTLPRFLDHFKGKGYDFAVINVKGKP